MPDQFGNAAYGGCDDGQAGGHGFHDGERTSFPKRGQGEDVGSGEDGGDILAETEEVDAFRERGGLGQEASFRLQTSRADEQEVAAWVLAESFLESADKAERIFLGRETGDGDDEEIIVPKSVGGAPGGAARGGGLELGEIDPVGDRGRDIEAIDPAEGTRNLSADRHWDSAGAEGAAIDPAPEGIGVLFGLIVDGMHEGGPAGQPGGGPSVTQDVGMRMEEMRTEFPEDADETGPHARIEAFSLAEGFDPDSGAAQIDFETSNLGVEERDDSGFEAEGIEPGSEVHGNTFSAGAVQGS